jgi:hypothetical protein
MELISLILSVKSWKTMSNCLSSAHRIIPSDGYGQRMNSIKIADICVKHNVLIVSDEIHMDFIYKPHQHHVLVNLSESYGDHVITLTAPSKTFNLPV